MIEEESVSSVLRTLIEGSGKTIRAVADETGVNRNTLYSIIGKGKVTNLVDLKTLETFARYFGYDITVFLGLKQYKERIELTADEEVLLDNYRHLKRLRPDMAETVLETAKDPQEPLTKEESNLLTQYQGMNKAGQGKILDFCLDLASSGRYRRDA